MNDLVFVMYNLKLKDRQVRKSIEMDDFENVSSDDEWIASEGTSYNEVIHEGEGDDEGDFVIENEDEHEGVDGEGEGDDEDNEDLHLEEVPLDEDEDEDDNEDEDGDEEEAAQHVEDHEFY